MGGEPKEAAQRETPAAGGLTGKLIWHDDRMGHRIFEQHHPSCSALDASPPTAAAVSIRELPVTVPGRKAIGNQNRGAIHSL
jgi:hypothetical protein